MEKVIVGMEPTGHYWLNLAHFLKGAKYQVCSCKSYACKEK